MNAARSVLGVFSLIGCTVGTGGGSTLSGGASASTGASATSSAATDDGSSEATTDQGSSDGEGNGEVGSTSSNGVDESSDSGASGSDDSGEVGASSEGSSSSDTGDDLADGILDVTIIAHDDCTITTMPASISVPEGTEFTVNWISAASSETNVDVAKIDAFNAVPIILGMEPGTAYHDEVRVWCGMLFTGTFDFEITSCFEPQLIPVDCGA